jgi:amino acid transporter
VMGTVLPRGLSNGLAIGIALAMYGAGLGAVTSASRMAFAFARDGGLPASRLLRQVDPRSSTPTVAIWTVAASAWLFTVWTPFYATITAVCSIFLYISYVLPTALGALAYRRSWTAMGPWNLGRWYRPLAALAVVGCTALVVIGMQPPNERSIVIVGGTIVAMALAWFASERRRFPGPPRVSANVRGIEPLAGNEI